jgi:hypothetical protein
VEEAPPAPSRHQDRDGQGDRADGEIRSRSDAVRAGPGHAPARLEDSEDEHAGADAHDQAGEIATPQERLGIRARENDHDHREQLRIHGRG